MNQSSKQFVLFISLLAVSLLIGTYWAYGYYNQQYDQAKRTESDFNEIQRLANAINSLKKGPQQASERVIEETQIAKRIEQAAKQNQISQKSITGIYPEPPRRVGTSAYLDKHTLIRLSNIPLPNLMGFLHELSATEPTLVVTAVNLNAPRTQASTNNWQVSVTLTYRIYSPPNSERNNTTVSTHENNTKLSYSPVPHP